MTSIRRRRRLDIDALSDEDYVVAAYHLLFGAEPDADGLRNYVAHLGEGTRTRRTMLAEMRGLDDWRPFPSKGTACGRVVAPRQQIGMALTLVHEPLQRSQETGGVTDQLGQQVGVHADHLAIGRDVVTTALAGEPHQPLSGSADVVWTKPDDLGSAQAHEEAEAQHHPSDIVQAVGEPHPPPHVVRHGARVHVAESSVRPAAPQGSA